MSSVQEIEQHASQRQADCPPLRVLVVGKNSAIVRSIADRIATFECVSHRDIEKLDTSIYDRVFIFSWSHVSLQENLSLLQRFRLDRVIFISTIAVLACARREQWSAYPRAKLVCENLVLKGGGKSIRVGIWDEKLLSRLPDIVPVTTGDALINAMYRSLACKEQLLWPIALRNGAFKGARHNAAKALNWLSLIIPSSKLMQAPIALLIRILGSSSYSYTHDCLVFFSGRVVVGFGAVGSAVCQGLDKRGLSFSIIASKDENLFLNDRGFRGMRIGQKKEGLANLWHGVSILENEDGLMFKKVPLIVDRRKVPRRVIWGSARNVDFSGPSPSVHIAHENIFDLRVFAEHIHLAAGVINNVKLLQSTVPMEVSFSDHEVAELGRVKTTDLLAYGLIRKRLGLIYGRRVISGKLGDVEYLLDFRPKSSDTIGFDSENLYNNHSDQIIKKLVGKLSLSLLNQAFFNKFGIAFDVSDFSVIAQIEARDCITLAPSGELSRSRLPASVIDGVTNQIKALFESFRRVDVTCTFDAIHAHGGPTVQQLKELRQYIEGKRLFLHGNALNGEPLGPFHNTVKMINKELVVIENV